MPQRRTSVSAALAAILAAVVLGGSLWLPWFRERLSTVFAPVRAERSVSGWTALQGLGGFVMILVAAALVWALGRARGRAASAVWLVIGGGLALMVEVAATVDRVGASNAGEPVTTTAPAAGLALAFAGALGLLLTGLAVLVRAGPAGGRAEAAGG